MAHQEINFSPYANNVMDFIDHGNLVTPKGDKVRITRRGTQFIIVIGEKVHSTSYNAQASYILNSAQVGITYREIE